VFSGTEISNPSYGPWVTTPATDIMVILSTVGTSQHCRKLSTHVPMTVASYNSAPSSRFSQMRRNKAAKFHQLSMNRSWVLSLLFPVATLFRAVLPMLFPNQAVAQQLLSAHQFGHIRTSQRQRGSNTLDVVLTLQGKAAH
jgi:hypothetical protein